MLENQTVLDRETAKFATQMEAISRVKQLIFHKNINWSRPTLWMKKQIISIINKITNFFLFNSNKLMYLRCPPIRSMNGLNIGFNAITKDQYEYWPMFKQEDTPRNRVTKRKLYNHIVVSI